MGLNSDGMSTMLYQMKNQEAGALVSIDGWEGKNNGSSYLKNSVYYDPPNIRFPLLEFQQHEQPQNDALSINKSLFDTLTHIDRFSYILKDFGHAYLTGNLIALPDLDKNTIAQHRFWYETVLKFFNAYLKEDQEAYESLWENKGFDESLIHSGIKIKSGKKEE